MKRLLCAVVMLWCWVPVGVAPRLAAQARAPHPAGPAPMPMMMAPAAPAVKDVAVATHHTIQLDGRTIPYTATAGSMVLGDGQGAPSAVMSYVAYTRDDVTDPATRPLAFLYDGGPGFASIWINVGAFGPERVVVPDAASGGAPPYRMVANEYSLLDRADLVFLDPVGTGFSHAVGQAHDRDFWGVDPDARSLAQFIRKYVSRHDRWNSPKFLMGLSYGTFRSAVLGNYLQSHDNISLNGIVLISSVLDLATTSFRPGADLPYELYLPTYAATAWYHKLLNPQPPDLPAFLQQVRTFARTTYADALMEGAGLSADRKQAIGQQLAQYTGLPVDYVLRADLRVNVSQFLAELQRSHGVVLSRLDSRYSGNVYDPLAEFAEYDPIRPAIYGAFTAAYQTYLTHALKFETDQAYVVSSAEAGRSWDWRHATRGARDGGPGEPNAGPDLQQALVTNPDLYVQVNNGYYDFATPFFATEYTMNHLGLPANLQDHISLQYYQSGHMIWLHVPSLARLSTNIRAFIAAHSQPKR
ncbi:MAG: peptidase S10 [Acidobacteriota bacterium]|nr:peptidase S10 [Acidobacteriota bacterium]